MPSRAGHTVVHARERSKEHNESASSIASTAQGQSNGRQSSRLRRSQRHQRHTGSSAVEAHANTNSASSSSNVASARSKSMASASNVNKPSLLWALGNSETADSVAMVMIKGHKDADDDGDEDATACKIKTQATPDMNLLHSVHANRMQLKATFYSICYPKQLLTSYVPIFFLLLNVKPNSDTQLAEHALHLAQLGTTSKDERAIREALRVYQATLLQLRRRIADPKTVIDEQLIAVVFILRNIETYSAISHDGSGRKRHQEGIGQLLFAKGPKTFQQGKSLPLRISLEIYQQSQLWELLAARKGSRTSTQEWIDVAYCHTCKWNLPRLTGYVLRLPALLQKTEVLLAQGEDATEEDVLNVLSAIKGFEDGLQKWMNRWYIEYPQVPYWRVRMDKCSWMKPLIKERTPHAFTSAYEFAGTATLKAHQQFWMALLASSEASKDLADLLPDPLPPHKSYEDQDRRLVDEVNDAADNLCMSAVYMFRPDNGVDGWIDACNCLQFASFWYERHGSAEKTVWCKTVIKGVESRGVRAPVLNGRRPRSE